MALGGKRPAALTPKRLLALDCPPSFFVAYGYDLHRSPA